MSAGDENRVLSYSTPRILYQAEFLKRNAQTILVLVMCIVGAAIFIAVGIRREGLFIWGGIVWLILAVMALYQWFLNSAALLQITDEGIRYGRKTWKWGQIQEVGGFQHSGGIQLYFSLRPDVHPIIKASFRQELPVTSRPSKDEFQRLIEQLKSFCSESFAHVHFEFEPQSPPWWN